MVIFDANMILRYLLGDNDEMKDMAKRYLINGDVWVTLEVAAEVVYVLKGVYHLDRQEISEKLMQFLELVECSENIVLRQALHTYAAQNLDFVDCILYAYNKVKGIEIASFDKKLLHLLAAQ